MRPVAPAVIFMTSQWYWGWGLTSARVVSGEGTIYCARQLRFGLSPRWTVIVMWLWQHWFIVITISPRRHCPTPKMSLRQYVELIVSERKLEASRISSVHNRAYCIPMAMSCIVHGVNAKCTVYLIKRGTRGPRDWVSHITSWIEYRVWHVPEFTRDALGTGNVTAGDGITDVCHCTKDVGVLNLVELLVYQLEKMRSLLNPLSTYIYDSLHKFWRSLSRTSRNMKNTR